MTQRSGNWNQKNRELYEATVNRANNTCTLNPYRTKYLQLMKKQHMKHGYFGIGIYHPKNTDNMGTLWRSAHNFGADFIFTIGKRYKRQASDTTKAERHIPLYEYNTYEDFKEHLPRGCQMVFVEQTEGSHELSSINHPKSCVYILGAEDHGVPENLMVGYQKVHVETPMCLNVAVAGSIVLYDRAVKSRAH